MLFSIKNKKLILYFIVINTYNIKAYLIYKRGKVEKLPNCYLCDKPAEIMCLKCNQDVCKDHFTQMGICTDCYERRLKQVKNVMTAIIILALIGIPVILFSVFFL